MLKKNINKIKGNIFLMQSINTLILRIVGVIILFGLTLYLTHHYDPTIIGQYDFIRTFLLVVGSLCLLGTEQSILYFSGVINSKGNINDLKKIYDLITFLILLTSIFVIILFQFVGEQRIASFFNDNKIYPILFKALLTLYFYCMTILNTEVFRALNSFYIAELFRNTFKYFSVIIGAVFLFHIKKEIYLVDTFLIGFVILAIISYIMILNLFRKEIKRNTKINTLNFSYKQIIKKSFPMSISGMAFFLIMSFDVFFIKKYCGSASVAYYSVAIKIITVLSMVIISVNIGVSTKIAEHFIESKKDLQETVKKSSRLIFIFSFPLVVLVCIFSKTILNFFGKGYDIASTSLILLMFGQGVNAAFGSVPIYLNMTGRQALFQYILIGAVIVDLILNIILVPKYGMIGSAIAFTSCSIFWILITSIIIYKKDKIKIFLH